MKAMLRAAAVVIATGSSFASADSAKAPPDLAQWGIYCFCQSAISTPQKVVLADNNGAILYRLREPAAKETLRQEGLAITDSQVLLLRTFGLVQRQDDGTWATAISTFGPDIMEPLRDRVRAIARRAAPALVDDAKAIAATLAATGHADSAFAIVFGRGLDGVTWDVLRERDALPGIDLDRDHPLWAGAFWAAFPERPGVPGTNASDQGSATIFAVWNDAVLTPLQAVADSPDVIAAARAVSEGRPTDYPIAIVREGDELDARARKIGAAVAAILLEDPEMQALLDTLPTRKKGEAMLVVAHEFVWDLLDELVSAGAVTPPPILSGGTDESALRALVFILARA